MHPSKLKSVESNYKQVGVQTDENHTELAKIKQLELQLKEQIKLNLNLKNSKQQSIKKEAKMSVDLDV
jgi:hypothetical protein